MATRNRYSSKVDLYWTAEGDFSLDTTKEDIKDTHGISYRAWIQQIVDIMQSSEYDWALDTGRGASLDKFVGRPNTRELGKAIHDKVINVLTRDGIVSSRDLVVDVLPLGPSEIGIVLVLSPEGAQSEMALTFSYDMRSNRIIPRNT